MDLSANQYVSREAAAAIYCYNFIQVHSINCQYWFVRGFLVEAKLWHLSRSVKTKKRRSAAIPNVSTNKSYKFETRNFQL